MALTDMGHSACAVAADCPRFRGETPKGASEGHNSYTGVPSLRTSCDPSEDASYGRSRDTNSQTSTLAGHPAAQQRFPGMADRAT